MNEVQLKDFLGALKITKTPFYSYEELAKALTAIEERLGDKKCMAMFLAQSSFETMGFTAFIENLYYTNASRIAAVWPSRFCVGPSNTKKNANNYVKNPQALANAVYANRGGNGNEASGDGYAFRGRGAFHLTFRDNYKNCSLALYNDERFVQDPALVEQCNYAFESAYWFWDVNGLSKYASVDNFTEVTRRINGSTATVSARTPYWTAAKKALGI